jgi:multicomponent Na+:H+ antiporter subunit D
VVNLLGSFVFLIAVAAIYHVTGALEMGTVAARMDEVEPNSVILIAVAVFVAFGVKLGLFPFHFWLPPVYTGARPAVAAILSGAIANIGPYGLIRFGGAILPAELEIGATVLAAVGGASILYGSMQAMARRATTEVLAYSSIGQNGYVLLALAVGGPLGFTAAIVYSLVNALNKTVLFFAAGARGRLVGAAFAIGAFSVVGVPPTAGFFAKVELFLAGIETGRYALVSLVVIGGALSFLYMFQIYQHDYWRSRDGVRFGMRLQLLVFAVAAFIVALGLWPEPLLRLTEHAVEGVLR